MNEMNAPRFAVSGAAIPGAGIDLHRRHGSPMETEPARAGNAHWSDPERQESTVVVFKRSDLDHLTPVFGTGQPPRGLSGLIRRLAYRVPEHRATHWALLLLGDRVDVFEHRLIERAPLAVAALAVAGAFRLGVSRRVLRTLAVAALGAVLSARRGFRARWTRAGGSLLRQLRGARSQRWHLHAPGLWR